jgi:hypothetical protein
MVSDILASMHQFQTLIAATLSVAATIVFAPTIGGRIAERYGRSREVWKRRLDFTSEMHRLSVALLDYVPATPGSRTPDSDEFYKMCLDFYSRGRIIYSADVEQNVLGLILRLPILEKELASQVLAGVARFLEAGTRSGSHERLSALVTLAKLSPEIKEASKHAYRLDRNPGMKALYVQTIEIFRSISLETTRLMRRHEIVRPWRWYGAIKMEIFRHQEKKRILASLEKKGLSPGGGVTNP